VSVFFWYCFSRIVLDKGLLNGLLLLLLLLLVTGKDSDCKACLHSGIFNIIFNSNCKLKINSLCCRV